MIRTTIITGLIIINIFTAMGQGPGISSVIEIGASQLNNIWFGAPTSDGKVQNIADSEDFIRIPSHSISMKLILEGQGNDKIRYAKRRYSDLGAGIGISSCGWKNRILNDSTLIYYHNDYWTLILVAGISSNLNDRWSFESFLNWNKLISVNERWILDKTAMSSSRREINLENSNSFKSWTAINLRLSYNISERIGIGIFMNQSLNNFRKSNFPDQINGTIQNLGTSCSISIH